MFDNIEVNYEIMVLFGVEIKHFRNSHKQSINRPNHAAVLLNEPF